MKTFKILVLLILITSASDVFSQDQEKIYYYDKNYKITTREKAIYSLSSKDAKNIFGTKTLTLTESKQIISSREWALGQMTKKDQEGNFMPREWSGLSWVFKTDGTAYMYITPEQKSAAEAKSDGEKYEITENEITLNTIPKQVFVYDLKVNKGYGGGYDLTLNDEKAGITYHLNAER
ncbi:MULTISPECIES: hypothetical protein [Flavobacterium]|uniref:GLPGLI family protein n=1 Tax=Flavobacterium ranwuense TaxID=2541725 RepID=A0ABY2DQC2_9FLAO|nr:MULTISPECIES: hypothetical protein [Flavobacterium]TDE28738.1 hypothetical protein E0I61_10100 [Flavobacterium ranwuense]TDE53070.1 hypothetical protein E0H99_10355 [Flavobacterium sp. GT3P67]